MTHNLTYKSSQLFLQRVQIRMAARGVLDHKRGAMRSRNTAPTLTLWWFRQVIAGEPKHYLTKNDTSAAL